MIKTAFLSVSLTLLAFAAAAQDSTPQNTPPRRPTSPLERAAAATELPLSPWGPYSQTHCGPCFIADRFHAERFAFPIVVGQRRLETQMRVVSLTNGKTRMRSERVALERRLMGLSPMQAWDDDRPTAATADAANAWNRWSRLREADGSGLYWSYSGAFAPASLSETVLNTPDLDGKILPPAAWTAGEATIPYFPANVYPGGDGLLIRVTLTNRAAVPANSISWICWAAGTPIRLATAPSDLAIERDPATDGMIVKSQKAGIVFALASNAAAFSQRAYRVSGAYFSPEGAVCERSAAGAAPAVRPAVRCGGTESGSGEPERKK